MAPNLAIDEKLLEESLALGGYKTKREIVDEAPREFIRRRQRLELVRWFGKINYDPGYDYRKERRRR
jgi:hypothetical protein